ncbi:MAG: IS21 family transposase [Gammaproteobacteria bacterium]
MSKIKHVLQLYFQGRSKQLIVQQTGVSRNTIKKYLKEYALSGLTGEEVLRLSEKELERLFIKPEEKLLSGVQQALFALFPGFDKELKKKGVTQQILWKRYREQYPEGVGRSQFNYYYHQWKQQSGVVMKMQHKAGDKLFVDYAGDKLSIVDKGTGEVQPVEVFVAILGASQLTYIEASFTQQKEDFVASCENAIHYYGGVPMAIVPDNLKSAVTKSHKYEPVINETLSDFASHYGTAILPARVYKPRDKALVENAVRLMYQRVYTKLHHHIFYSLEELNQALWIALEEHNEAKLSNKPYSRREQFEEMEKGELLPLPPLRYELKQQCYGTVMKNGHVCLGADKHYYSVPYRFIGKKVTIRYSTTQVEVHYKHDQIALHQRTRSSYHYTTEKEHMASTHRFVSEWTPEKFIHWAQSIHPVVYDYIVRILNTKQHPEQNYRSCLGILGFAKKVGKERLIKACERANHYEIYNYKMIQSILERGLDGDDNKPESASIPSHDNIRGGQYYQ